MRILDRSFLGRTFLVGLATATSACSGLGMDSGARVATDLHEAALDRARG